MSKENSVLIIEDSKAIGMLLKNYLEKLGYSEIHICETGSSAITTFNDLISQNKEPIVLLDYMLPDMDARSVLTQMLEKKVGSFSIISIISFRFSNRIGFSR